MWLIFVDDTKQKGQRSGMGDLLALGAVAFPEDRVAAYAERVSKIYEAHDVPVDTELKWSIRKDSWFKKEPGSECLTQVRRDCLEAAAECGCRAIVVIFDLGRTSVQGDVAAGRVLEYLYERMAMMMSAPDDRAIIICDKPGGGHKQEDTWIAGTLSLTNYGTKYVEPGSVILPILTAPSHHHAHLQLADLVVGSLTAAVAGVKFGMELVPLVKNLLHTNHLGAIPGTGLKLFPDELLNTYCWVLGADTYFRGNVGVPLPRRHYPYDEDDGLGIIGNLRARHASKRYGRVGKTDESDASVQLPSGS